MRSLSARSLVVLAIALIWSVCRADAALVTFHYRSPAPGEHDAYLAGAFNNWSTTGTPMADEDGDGIYEVVVHLVRGEHEYKFVVDEEWITDESAVKFAPDGFGGRNSVIIVDDSFEEPRVLLGDGEIMRYGVEHAQVPAELMISAAGAVTIRTRAWSGDVEEVCLLLACGDSVATLAMRPFETDGTYDYFEVTFDEAECGQSFTYSFALRDGSTVLFMGPHGLARDATTAGRFRYDSASALVFETPDWVKRGIMYQIFPERFSNGRAGNDPDFSEWYYEGLTDLPASGKLNDEYFHLVDDWYDVAGLSKSEYRTDGRPDWYSFYGGDIEGVRRGLDYLADLGITVIYFNPVFEARSSHKYDAVDYMRIDPHFGTNEEFAEFVSECHERGIRVVLDLAINHTGETFWAFVDSREKGQRSPYWHWYEWKKWPLPDPLPAGFKALDYYDCWWGFSQMPNLNFDLSRENPDEQAAVAIEDAEPNWPVVEHLLSVAEYWISEVDVDGFRLDVAGEVPLWFWQLFRERVKEEKPDAYIVGELWGSSPEWVHATCFDAVMNYAYFREPILDFLVRGKTTAHAFADALTPGRIVYPGEGVMAMMNLVGSHDTERFLTLAGGDVRKLKLAAVIGMTYVGAPHIYYGDEIGMTGGKDPDCRRPFNWKWADDSVALEIHDFYQKLIALRREHDCLVSGTFEVLLAGERALAYRRAVPGDEIIVVINAGETAAELAVPLGGTEQALEFVDAVDGREIGTVRTTPSPSRPRVLSVRLEPMSGHVLLPKRHETDEPQSKEMR